ncbi:hypothetical protein HU752_023755 [Pseudomonas vanderleydeniana]|uniref:Uncharacterized protein n=2 Tax=Pseudomonas vanderleydeniana TaxID=2745495 RepID=A0A9E6PI26_9PSED|nr:hypothetical protein HU752_023755 [Pseudomonas vanderleydeniana]
MKDLEIQKPQTSLQAPVVAVAAPEDGLLQVAALSQPLEVTITLWNYLQPEETCQLLWNGELVGTPVSMEPYQTGDQITLLLPEQLLSTEGKNNLQYIAVNTINAESTLSYPTQLIIDRTPAGGQLLAAVILPSIALDGLTNSELVELGNQLTAIIPGYFDMKWGDVIQSYWGEHAGPSHTVQADEVGTDKVRLSVDRNFLEQLGHGEFAVSYSVRDRAGNISVRSQPVTLKLQLQHLPANLAAPVPLKIENGQVHDLHARLGVKIAVPTYDHVAIGDEIRVLWNGEPVGGKRMISAHELGKPLLLNVMVTYLSISRHGDGPARVNYQVCRNGEIFVSPDLALDVFLQLPGPQDPTPKTLVNEALAVPVVKSKNPTAQSMDNYLDEDSAHLSADVVIGWRDAFRAGDRINLFWGKAQQPLVRPINQQDVDSGCYLVINVPNSLIVEQGCGVDIRVQYTVTREDNPNTSYSPKQLVAVIFQIQLPGGEEGLMEPVFSGASVLNVVDPRKDPEGTVVHIAPYRNMKEGDRILLRFCGFDALTGGNPIDKASYSSEHVVTARDLRYGYRFRVPLARLMAVEHGRGRAHYEVSNNLGRSTSLPADVYISSRTPVKVR